MITGYIFGLTIVVTIAFLLWRYATPPARYCLRFHRLWHLIRTQQNIKTATGFFLAVWCQRCERVRFIEHMKCPKCGFFFKLYVFKEHRENCRFIGTNFVMIIPPGPLGSAPATEADFEWFFGVAKAHNLSLENCQQIAMVEMQKPLNTFTLQELVDFGKRVCNDAHGPLMKGGE